MSEGWLAFLYSFLAHDLVVLILVPVVLSRRTDPAVSIAWIFAILFLPFIGAIGYVLFGNNRMARRALKKGERKRRRRSRIPTLICNLASPIDVKGQLQLFKLLETICPVPAVAGNAVEILIDMERNYDAQLEAIAGAKDHVHIEYYIFQSDSIGGRFKDALIAAARRGVKIRFLYDAVGSWGLARAFLKEMIAAGVETAAFIPLNPLTRRWIFNFRNHRKILVVDGDVGFLGGANIGDEYLGDPKTGPWRDTQIRLEGPVVVQLQKVFAEDWYFASGKDAMTLPEGQTIPHVLKEKKSLVVVGADKHRPGERIYASSPTVLPEVEAPGDIVAQIVPGGPDMGIDVFHELYFSAVTNAVQRIHITTPYFVPSEAVLVAIQTAARRGVDVRLLVPGKSAHFLMKLASDAYMQDLLDAGVKVYEYDNGFMHSKVLTVDGRWSIVGTANFDNRSMKLNFEIGVALYSQAETQRLDDIFEDNIRQSRRVDPALWRRRPWSRRILENTVALFSPIL